MKYAHMQLAAEHSMWHHAINGLEALAFTFIILCVISIIGWSIKESFERWPIISLTAVAIIVFLALVFWVF